MMSSLPGQSDSARANVRRVAMSQAALEHRDIAILIDDSCIAGLKVARVVFHVGLHKTCKREIVWVVGGGQGGHETSITCYVLLRPLDYLRLGKHVPYYLFFLQSICFDKCG